jgi:putative spermidine/putrescine transport system ATP-binding protein
MTHVQLASLTKRYGPVTAVDGLDLTVATGELVALLGPSGCGKTTTMRMIAGLLAPTAGDVRFDNVSVLRVPAERRGAVMVFQKHLLFPHLSVGENVAFGLKLRRLARQEIEHRVAEMLALVQLPGFAERRPHELSGGQQQRVALARALVIAPRVLLLDEPLANLDANLRLEMRKLIRTIQQRLGITTIFVTHDQEEAIMLADRIALLERGRLLQFGSPRQLYEEPQSVAVARFFRNENFLPGVKQGTQVTTACGTFALAQTSPLPDGPVLLTARPEHVRIGSTLDAPNVSQATIIATIYLGGYQQVQLRVGEATWQVHAPVNLPIVPGASVTIHPSPEHLWCLPPS